MNDSLIPAISDYTAKFLEELGVPAIVTVNFDSGNNLYLISLSSDNPGLLIGYHGDTLGSFQLILAQHLKTQTGQWLNISVNINDYRQRRETALHELAESVANQVVATGQPHTLTPLPANERRVIHLHLSNHSLVITSSVGEGRSRSIVISPKE